MVVCPSMNKSGQTHQKKNKKKKMVACLSMSKSRRTQKKKKKDGCMSVHEQKRMDTKKKKKK